MMHVGSKIVFRRAKLGDVQTLVDYRIRFLNELNGVSNDEKTEVVRQSLLRYFTKAIPSGDFVGWVAECNGRIIGTAGMVVWEKPALYEVESGRFGYLLNFYTIQEERGRGIATRLLKELIKEAKSLGLKHLHLHASRQGESIYRKAGFKEPQMPELTLRLD